MARGPNCEGLRQLLFFGNINKGEASRQEMIPRSTLFPCNSSDSGVGANRLLVNRAPVSGAAKNHLRHKAYRYRVWQCKIYNYLERPRGWRAGLYHILM